MVELRLATEIESEPEDGAIECSWSSVICGIERYAAYQPRGFPDDLVQWARLLDDIRQLREKG